ncbi:hypothetical protein H6F50_03550 [Coleofasciculus sp. FACHB-712]|uniref:hypothetical protein n=1 Tax=Coleofasciculus sp. FACHB-712 TaxID=2692789 RepID=UPI00168A151A|nr:hypothetical protein [Coleofasciculus sp. FACHB-712]MBD1941436.1 hypothetical protein [Coleofasciculus sp. FACHB-712]
MIAHPEALDVIGVTPKTLMPSGSEGKILAEQRNKEAEGDGAKQHAHLEKRSHSPSRKTLPEGCVCGHFYLWLSPLVAGMLQLYKTVK